MPPDPEPREPPPSTTPAAPSSGPRRRRRWPALLATSLLAVAAVVFTAMAFIHVPYVIISPGEATPLGDQVVSVSGAPTYGHAGDVLYLTVRVTNDDPNVWRYLFAQLDDDVSVEKREDIIGCADYEESGLLNQDLMVQSQNTAKAVALERLGYTVEESGAQVVIVNVECGGPSDGRLRLADVVTAVDGTVVTTAEDVRPLVQAHRPGDTVRFTVERGGKTRRGVRPARQA